jgi:hypothetical protein
MMFKAIAGMNSPSPPPPAVQRGKDVRDEDGDGVCEIHVNTMEGTWSLLRSWLRPHRGISQEKLTGH